MRQMVIILDDESIKGDENERKEVVNNIGNMLKRHGVVIQPQLKSSQNVSKYLYTNNIKGAWVDALREEVEGLPGVEAAYLKPMDELP